MVRLLKFARPLIEQAAADVAFFSPLPMVIIIEESANARTFL
jgi:hypothetical protein